ncbi:MAG TPA: hypothetical protein VF334_04440 [Polyangia bacterium]
MEIATSAILPTRAALALLACAAAGCNSLSAKAYAGTVIELAIEGAAPTTPGQHLELWARDAYADILRVDAIYDLPSHRVAYGLRIRNAIALDDPCMIVSDPGSPAYGEPLVMPSAYPSSVMVNGVTQTPTQQAQQVRNRIAQLTSNAVCLPDLFDATATFCGHQASTLLAVVPYDETPPPSLPPDAPASARAAACEAYWSASPLAYTPNPAQLTTPLHGAVYGFIGYLTTVPPAGYDGLRLDSPTNLRGIEELWLTVESVPVANVDALSPGRIYLDGAPTPGGRDVIHFDLRSLAMEAVSGTAALYVSLDDDTASF